MTPQLHSLVAALSFLVLATAAHGEATLVPTLDSKLEAASSVVYCPTLVVAWDALEGILNGHVEMREQDELVQRLNDAKCPNDVLPEEAHVSMAGYTAQGIASKIKEALVSKFGANAPEVPAVFSDERTALVTYSYLSRNLPFPKKFARSSTIPMNFRSGRGVDQVEFFGAPPQTADDFGSQVEILHYAGETDFVIRLASQIEDEFIVLAKIPLPATLFAGVETVRTYLRGERKAFTELEVNGQKHFYMDRLAKGDLLAIPVVEFSVAANFPELCDRRFRNIGFEQMWLHRVYQDIRFKMDEAGATVRSTAYGAAAFGGSAKPRKFLFDQPFLLTLWKEGAEQPYLAAWIASADVLVPFKSANAIQ